MNTLLVGLALVLAAASPQVEVETLDQRVARGALVALDGEKVVIETADGPIEFETKVLRGVSPTARPESPPPDPVVWVDLADGSRLLGSGYAVKDGRATIALGDDPPLEVATAQILSVRLQPAAGPILAEWERIVGMETLTDVLVIRRDDAVNYLRGALGNVTDEAVEFEYEGERIPVRRTRVLGLVHRHRPGRSLPEAVCTLTDAGGSRWAVKSLEFQDGLAWTTVGGLEVERPVERVQLLDFSAGKIIYLSDLEPESVRFTPFFGTADGLPSLAAFYAPRMDRNLSSKPLSIDGRQYRKGIAMHSRTELVYRLPGRFSRFEAVAGIDDAVRPHGNVRLEIRADERVLFEATITGADPPKTIALEPGDARRLSILVDFGEDLGVADHLNLCNARIIR
jgi:hypothetical protein